MKKMIFLSILTFVLICGIKPAHCVAETKYNLPSEPIRQPRVVYLKWGQKLVCDYVWRDGDTIFVVVHGKKFAVGYGPGDIDMERSFGVLPKESVQRKIKGGSVAELYEKSGMGALIDQIEGLYVAGLNQNQGKLPADLLTAMRSAGREAFDANKMRKKVLEVMEKNFDPDLTQRVLGWLQSPLGQKITVLESIQFNPHTVKEMEAYGLRLQSNPPTPKRLGLIRRLDAGVGASEKNAEVALMILGQTISAVGNAMPEETKGGLEDINRLVEVQRPQLLEMAREATEIGFLYMYQTLTDEELERYVSFSESETGKAYHSKAFEAFMAALSESAEENGRSVAKILGDYMQRRGG